jgi:hypothetical protein
MPAKITAQLLLENKRKTWGFVAQFVVFIFGILGSFLLPPPGWATSGDQRVVRLGQFIVAVLVGLIFLLVQRWNRKQHVSRWVLLTITFLALSVVAFFGYQHLLDTRTCRYADDTVVIGTRYTEHVQSYLSENPNSTCASLLEDFAGKSEDIWTRESIDNSRYILAGTYIINLPLFTICVIAVVQAIYCSTRERRSRTSAKKSRGPQPRNP